jgi:predicted flap endonuclease-1-like 5' DNA nuclease
MTIDRSGRITVAAFLFVAAVLLLSSTAVTGGNLLSFALPLALAVLGFAFLFLEVPRRGSVSFDEPEETAAPVVEREYLPPAAAPVEVIGAPAAPAAPAELAAPAPAPEATPETAPAVPGRADNLLVVNGIGPKINAALNAAGITTYAGLAAATPERLHEILTAASVRLTGSVADSLVTWPKQAEFLAAGDTAGLLAYNASVKAQSGD